MKTFCHKLKYVFFTFILAGCFLFLNSSCGLDEFYVVDNPTQTIHTPIYSSIDKVDNYFSFVTNERGMVDYINNPDSSFTFEGTEVYYKIYNNYSNCSSEYSTLYNLFSSENYSSAATKLIEKTGFNFLPLKCENYNETPLIPATGTNRTVVIRLTDYLEDVDSSNSAKILINDVSIAGEGKSSAPRRNGLVGNGNLSFNFGRTGDNDKAPNDSDEDTKYGTFTTEDVYYVSLYAVAVGRDSNYTTYYSNILHLGTVSIDASSENN